VNALTVGLFVWSCAANICGASMEQSCFVIARRRSGATIVWYRIAGSFVGC